MYRVLIDKPYSGRFSLNDATLWRQLANLLDDASSSCELTMALHQQFTVLHWRCGPFACVARLPLPQRRPLLVRRVSDGFKAVATLSGVDIYEPKEWRFTAEQSGWYSLNGELIAPAVLREGALWMVAGEGAASWTALSERMEQAAQGVLLARGMSFATEAEWYWYRFKELLVSINLPQEHWQGWSQSLASYAMQQLREAPKSSLPVHLAEYGLFGLVELTCEEFCYLIDSDDWLKDEPERALFDNGEPITSKFDEISKKHLGGRKPVYTQYLTDANHNQVYRFARTVSERAVLRGKETQCRVYLVPLFDRWRLLYADDRSWTPVGLKAPVHPIAVRDEDGALLVPVPGHWGLRSLTGALPFVLHRLHVRAT